MDVDITTTWYFVPSYISAGVLFGSLGVDLPICLPYNGPNVGLYGFVCFDLAFYLLVIPLLSLAVSVLFIIPFFFPKDAELEIVDENKKILSYQKEGKKERRMIRVNSASQIKGFNRVRMRSGLIFYFVGFDSLEDMNQVLRIFGNKMN